MKTFYSVKQGGLGYSQPVTRWFDSLDKAKKFTKLPYTDNVIVHNLRDEGKILQIEYEIENQFEVMDYDGSRVIYDWEELL